MDNRQQGRGWGMAKNDVERQIQNDEIVREFVEISRARRERMKDLNLTEGEALAGTFYVLLVDYAEARTIGERTFAGEFASRRGKGKRPTE